MRTSVRSILPLLALLTLGACDWFDGDKPKPLEGKREAVLQQRDALAPSAELASVPLVLPQARTNSDWPQRGLDAAHAPGHLALGAGLSQSWSASLGEGASGDLVLLVQPVVMGDFIYASDAAGQVTAYRVADGTRVWRTETEQEGRDEAMAGGLAADATQLYLTTGHGDVVAFDRTSGDIRWRKNFEAPLRAAPLVADGQIYVLSTENRLFALAAADGRTLWDHRGISELASILGAATPAIVDETVYAAYSSGEVYALRAANGRVAWSDALVTNTAAGALPGIADIRGAPVVMNNVLYAVSHSGRLVAVDARNGNRLWEQPIGGTNMPWVAGDTLFLLADDPAMMALTLKTGAVRWRAELPAFEDMEDHENAITWQGPVFAGSQLWVCGAYGEMWALDPNNGSTLQTLRLPADCASPPIVAGGRLFVVTVDGDLVAFASR